MVNNILKTCVQDKLVYEFKRFSAFLRKNTPQEIKIGSPRNVQVEYLKGETVSNVTAVDVIISQNRLMLSHNHERICSLLNKIVLKSLEKFSIIPSPEPIVLKEIFGPKKNHEGIKVDLPLEG